MVIGKHLIELENNLLFRGQASVFRENKKKKSS